MVVLNRCNPTNINKFLLRNAYWSANLITKNYKIVNPKTVRKELRQKEKVPVMNDDTEVKETLDNNSISVRNRKSLLAQIRTEDI